MPNKSFDPKLKNQRRKPKYEPPKVESEGIFEKRALACGKCRTGPHRQNMCMLLPSVS